MADLGVSVRPGVVVAVGSGLGVNVDGSIYSAPWWPATYVPAAGDPVRVLLCAGEASILGPTIPGQRSPTGTVSGSAVGGLLPVTVGTSTVQCRYLGAAPTAGTLVLLSWEATTPWVIGSAASYIPPIGDVAPPIGPSAPPVTTSGTLTLSAVDSGTYTLSWSKIEVDQDVYAGYPHHGAWFYGSSPGQLAGATITGFRLRLGARLRIGSYNAAVTLGVYRVVQGAKSGPPTYADGPTAIPLGVNAVAQWVTLPTSVGQNLVNAGGGGMGINGTGYAGVAGLDLDPASGQIALDWQR
ncbi:MAG: hypothetical protein M0Z51_16780 [Propionibacterium sp.]|nr:hypothetical protein [Propionibacterium sp.]